MKTTQTAIVDLGVFQEALNMVGNLSGEVSFVKVQPIINKFAESIIPPPDEEEQCLSPTPPKSSSRKSGTNTK